MYYSKIFVTPFNYITKKLVGLKTYLLIKYLKVRTGLEFKYFIKNCMLIPSKS